MTFNTSFRCIAKLQNVGFILQDSVGFKIVCREKLAQCQMLNILTLLYFMYFGGSSGHLETHGINYISYWHYALVCMQLHIYF